MSFDSICQRLCSPFAATRYSFAHCFASRPALPSCTPVFWLLHAARAHQKSHSCLLLIAAWLTHNPCAFHCSLSLHTTCASLSSSCALLALVLCVPHTLVSCIAYTRLVHCLHSLPSIGSFCVSHTLVNKLVPVYRIHSF